MRLLFLTLHSPFHEITGPIAAGAEIAMRRIAEMLAARGHEVHYLTFTDDPAIAGYNETFCGIHLHVLLRSDTDAKNIGLAGFARATLRGTRTVLQHIPMRRKIKPLNSLLRVMNRVIDKLNNFCWGYKTIIQELVDKHSIELIHCFSSLPDSLAAAMVCQKSNIPLTIRMGGRYWFLKYIRLAHPRRQHKYLSNLNYVFEHTALFAFNSRFIKKETGEMLEQLHLPQIAHSELVDIGVRIPEASSENALDFESLGIAKDDFVFSCVGKFKDDSKRQDVLVKALANLHCYPNVKVVFAGDGPNLEAMQEIAERLRVASKIVFLGNIPHDAVFSLVTRSQVFVHPTDFEGSSKAVAEAMLCKKAIIASDIPANAEHIIDEQNGLLSKNTPYDFAVCMQRVLADQQFRETLATNAYRYACEHFNPENNILEYERIFGSVIKGEVPQAREEMLLAADLSKADLMQKVA